MHALPWQTAGSTEIFSCQFILPVLLCLGGAESHVFQHDLPEHFAATEAFGGVQDLYSRQAPIAVIVGG